MTKAIINLIKRVFGIKPKAVVVPPREVPKFPPPPSRAVRAMKSHSYRGGPVRSEVKRVESSSDNPLDYLMLASLANNSLSSNTALAAASVAVEDTPKVVSGGGGDFGGGGASGSWDDNRTSCNVSSYSSSDSSSSSCSSSSYD